MWKTNVQRTALSSALGLGLFAPLWLGTHPMRGQTIDTERSATEKKEEKAKEEKAKKAEEKAKKAEEKAEKAEEKAKKAEEKAEKAEEKAEEQDPCKYKGDGKVIPEHDPCPKPNKSESTPPIR
jgi:uncharacterized protein HemX